MIYQIYPFGFCGAPRRNDGRLSSRIRKVTDWIPYLKSTGITAVMFNPVFESDAHGYDVRDYSRIDCRLGTNDDFRDVCDSLHDAGIKVILDASYNHAGRGFPYFQDVVKNKKSSSYQDWFYIDFSAGGRDGFSYADWEGHSELVKLNLQNEAVVSYLISRTDQWIGEFGIDGLRLDAAHILDRQFIRRLCSHIRSYIPDFLFIGENTTGNARELISDGLLDSVTNYELKNTVIDSFQNKDLNPAADCLRRQYANDFPSGFRGRQLLTFADNHDVNRAASELEDPLSLSLLYALLFAVPGIPCLYYGSEWGEKGRRKRFSDLPLRPSFARPKPNKLTEQISTYAKIHSVYSVFSDGDFKILCQNKEQLVFRRRNSRGQLTFAVNISPDRTRIKADTEVGEGIDLIRKKKVILSDELDLPAKEAFYYYTDWL